MSPIKKEILPENLAVGYVPRGVRASPREYWAKKIGFSSYWYLRSGGPSGEYLTRNKVGSFKVNPYSAVDYLMAGMDWYTDQGQFRNLLRYSDIVRGRRRTLARGTPFTPPKHEAAPIGSFRITCPNPPTDILLQHGEDVPNVSGGYGGFEEIERPGRDARVQYKGSAAFKVSLSAIMDKFETGEPVLYQMEALERLAHPLYNPLMIVQVEGPGLWLSRVRHWVIDNIEWGAAEQNPRTGYRSRQFLTIQLLGISADDHSPYNCSNSYIHTYRVKHGETLERIAYRIYGTTRCAGRIQSINRIRDPRSIYVGQILRIP